MDLRKIKTLVDLVSESNIAELEITEAEGTVRIVKGGGAVVTAAPMMVAAPAALQAVTAPVNAATPAQAATTTAATVTTAAHTIKSPMVGTYYASPSPEAKAFVKVGDTVKKGQTVCIIEAMKIMNEIEADADGTVSRVLAESAQGVEYGQPLFELS